MIHDHKTRQGESKALTMGAYPEANPEAKPEPTPVRYDLWVHIEGVDAQGNAIEGEIDLPDKVLSASNIDDAIKAVHMIQEITRVEMMNREASAEPFDQHEEIDTGTLSELGEAMEKATMILDMNKFEADDDLDQIAQLLIDKAKDVAIQLRRVDASFPVPGCPECAACGHEQRLAPKAIGGIMDRVFCPACDGLPPAFDDED